MEGNRCKYLDLYVKLLLTLSFVKGALSTLFALARTYFVRGSVRESEYFLEEARTLATSLEVPGMLTRAQVRLGELKWHSARASEANDHLQSALEGLSKVSIMF